MRAKGYGPGMQRSLLLRWVFGACVALSVLGASGCYSQVVTQQPAKLRVVAVPDTTTVYVEDQFIGSARVLAVRPKSLRPGVKHITFKAPGHFPHDLRVDLPAGTTTIEMKLRKIPL